VSLRPGVTRSQGPLAGVMRSRFRLDAPLDNYLDPTGAPHDPGN